jgi:hypothetical protein
MNTSAPRFISISSMYVVQKIPQIITGVDIVALHKRTSGLHKHGVDLPNPVG